jgi:WD40 repeat protein
MDGPGNNLREVDMSRSALSFSLFLIVAMVPAIGALAQGAAWSLPRLKPMTVGTAAGVVALHAFPCPIGNRLPAQCVVTFTPDGSRIVASSLSPEVTVFALASGQTLRKIATDGAIAIGIAISPDGKSLAIASGTTVRLCDSATGALEGILAGHAANVRELAFSPDGQSLAAGCDNAEVWLWELKSRKPYAKLSGGRRYVLSLDYSPDGSILAEGGVDGYARLRNGKTGEVIRQLRVGKTVGDLAFSPDGKLLATASDDNCIRLWNPATGELRATLIGHGDFVNGVAFSPDGSLLASGSHDRQVGLWDVKNERLIAMLEGHKDAVLRVAFSPDGRSLASISWDGSILLWGLPTH